MRVSTECRVVLGLIVVTGASLCGYSQVSAENHLVPERNIEKPHLQRDLPRSDSRGTREARLAQARERRAAARQNLVNALRNRESTSVTQTHSAVVNSETSQPNGATENHIANAANIVSEHSTVGASLIAQHAETAVAGHPNLGLEHRNVPQPRPGLVERHDLQQTGSRPGPHVNIENRPQRGLVPDRAVNLSKPGK